MKLPGWLGVAWSGVKLGVQLFRWGKPKVEELLAPATDPMPLTAKDGAHIQKQIDAAVSHGVVEVLRCPEPLCGRALVQVRTLTYSGPSCLVHGRPKTPRPADPPPTTKPARRRDPGRYE